MASVAPAGLLPVRRLRFPLVAARTSRNIGLAGVRLMAIRASGMARGCTLCLWLMTLTAGAALRPRVRLVTVETTLMTRIHGVLFGCVTTTALRQCRLWFVG